MTRLLLLDESGHDHKNMPYEVRGGVALHARELWAFVQFPSREMDAAVRTGIAEQFGPWLNRLQYRGQRDRDGEVFESYGIGLVPNPYGPGRA